MNVLNFFQIAIALLTQGTKEGVNSELANATIMVYLDKRDTSLSQIDLGYYPI
jgi:hypothetical protein